MYGKFFIILSAIAFATTIIIDIPTAFGQDQTSNLTTLSSPISNNTMAITNMTNTTVPEMTLDDAREQYLSVWNQTEFNAAFSTFIDAFSAAGYGVYKEHSSNVFAPGETIVLYVEPVAFGHKQIQDEESNTTLYLINMTADYKMAGTNGTELQMIGDFPTISAISHRPNTEMFLTLTIPPDPQKLPPGNYTITYIVHDQVSGKSFEIEKGVTIDENATADSATMNGEKEAQLLTENIQLVDLKAARQQFLTAWSQREFNSTFDSYIEPFSAAGYGVYKEHSNVFAPGETIVLYVEPVAFGHKQIQDEESNTTLYLINMTADYEIATADGAELQVTEDMPTVTNITSHRLNIEVPLTVDIRQDVRSLPPGNYVIKYTVNDEVSGESFQLEKEITIAQNVTASSNLA